MMRMPGILGFIGSLGNGLEIACACGVSVVGNSKMVWFPLLADGERKIVNF